MMTRVKKFASTIPGRPACSPFTVSLLDASGAGQADPARVVVDLLSAGASQGGQVKDPPEWVRFLAPGPNKARDGRGVFMVDDTERIIRLSNEYKGAIDLLIDFEHQFDRARVNGQPAPAAAWITDLSAVGPDGTPGIWARVDWLPDTVELIRQRKYRYLSATIAETGNVVTAVMRASLTNQPAVDTASALFSSQPKEPVLNALVVALLGALGITNVTSEADAEKTLKPLAALLAALAKQAGLEIATLSAMTAEQVSAALQKPLAEKLATLSATANVATDASTDAIVSGLRSLGVDPKKYIDRSVYDDVAGRLATLTAETMGKQIDDATKAGKLTPAMKAWAEGLSFDQLTGFLSTAPVIVAPNGGGGGGGGPLNVATLSAEEKAAAQKHGVTEEVWLAAKQEEAEVAARHRQLAAS